MGKVNVKKEMITIVCKFCKMEFVHLVVFRDPNEDPNYYEPNVVQQTSVRFCPHCGKGG